MKKSARICIYLGFALAAAASTSAQPASVMFEIRDGLVRLDARDASVAQILERWARVGSVTVVNAEALANTRVTVRLDGVHFREALAIILRDAGGYIATSRPSRTGAGTELDRILISRATPAQPAAGTTVAARRATASRVEPPAAAIAPDPPIAEPLVDDTAANTAEAVEAPASSGTELPTEPQRYGPDGTPIRQVPGLTPAQAAALPPRPPGVVRGPEDLPIVGSQGGKYPRVTQPPVPPGPLGATGTSAQPGAVAPAPQRSGPPVRPPATAGNP